jgi:hypothetical protein
MRRNGLGALIRNSKGSTAIEFALVAPLFFALMFSILEAGWYFFVTSAVQQANANAARLIRTGQAQEGISKDVFFAQVCDIVDRFGDCNETLTIDVTKYSNFAALADDLSTPVCRDKDDPSIQGSQFSESDYGGERDIVRVRVCFLYRPINPALGLNLRKTKHGEREVISVSIFRNEPFDS